MRIFREFQHLIHALQTAVSSIPGVAWQFFFRLADIFSKNEYSKNYQFRVSSPIRSEILENIPEPLAKLGTLHAKLLYKYRAAHWERRPWFKLNTVLGVFTSTLGIHKSCAGLLVLQALRGSSQLLSLCLISSGIRCTTPSVVSVSVNQILKRLICFKKFFL